MNEVFKLFGTIGINNDEANRGLDETAGKGKATSEKISGYFKTAAKVIGTVFALDKIINFAKVSVEAAASAQAIQAQFDQVFAELGPSAQNLIDTMGKDLGMLPNRLKGPLTDATSRFKGLGLTTEEAMAQAEIAVRGAADAAAFYDVSYENANASLTSFTKGNYEGGEAIGIFANDTQMAQYAIKQGIVSTTGEWQKLDEATKQATRLDYAMNMQEMAGATGQASRESDGLENVLGNLNQAWTDFKAIVGGPMLEPVIAGLTSVTQGLMDGALKLQEFQLWMTQNETAATMIGIALGVLTALIIAYNIQQGLAAAQTTVWGIVSGVATAATTALGAAFTFLTSPISLIILAIGAIIAIGYLLVTNWEWIKEQTATIFSAIGTFIGNAIDGIIGFFQDVMNFITNNWQSILLFIVNPFAGAFALLYNNFEGFRNAVNTTVTMVKTFFAGMWTGISATFSDMVSGTVSKFNAIKTAIMTPIDTAATFVKTMIDKIKGFFNFSWSLPKLKMPHVSITGGFSLMPPKVPKFGLEWYKDGGIMTNPTAFGRNGNDIMVGGEADKEVILPLNDKNLGGIGQGIAEASSMSDTGVLGKLVDRVDTLIELVKILLRTDKKYQLLLDTGVLAGELTPYVNAEIGKYDGEGKRGRR